ncbi:MAG TPA: DUF1289 domain-containing protein [Gemmatimonadales bacterium]|nr:DUF1289 domain-containing protein [Gemmatimonadales bacterium]
MSGRPRVVVSWSSGKDAAWALYELQRGAEVDVVGLVTSVVPEFGRVSMHGVRAELARMQAAAAGLPLAEVPLPWPCSNEVYEERTLDALERLRRDRAVTHVAFGDLFLEDVRAYRERLLSGSGLAPLFPLWGRDTTALLAELLRAGVRAHIVCLDPARLPRELAGRPIDASLAARLPADVDRCGERGEFHTFVSAGPMFARAIAVRAGPVIERDGFVYADLLPVAHDEPNGTTPCRGTCRLGPDDVCDGCGRTIAEVVAWLALTPDERSRVCARVAAWRPR